MRDIGRVYLIQITSMIPFFIAVFVGAFLYLSPPATASLEWLLLLVISAVFAYIIFWKSPRLRHYNRAYAEFEDNYRYEKEAN